jgi:hypothetical protein
VILKIEAKIVTPPNQPARLSPRTWMIIPLLALVFLVWTDSVRLQRVETTTSLAEEPVKTDVNSPTGYAGGARELIVPEHNNDSYHWIAQTQQMLARGEVRVRHVDYDNAPFGRAVDSTSPYRWWLGLVAWSDHAVSGRSLGRSVERAALFADPLLHVILFVSVAAFVAWQFGMFYAAMCAAGVATLFPFAAGFIPGAPDDRGLSLACTVWSILPLLAGLRDCHQAGAVAKPDSPVANRRAQRWFFVAGVAGGLGMWVSMVSQVPLIFGIFLGGLVAAWTARSPAPGALINSPEPTLWLAWALGGALTVLAACLMEYFPDHLATWELRVIHPLYGVAWLGLGVVLAQAVARIQRGRSPWNFRALIALVLAVAAVAAVPVFMWKMKNEGFLATAVNTFQLAKLPGGAVATTPWAWLLREGFSTKVWTVLLPCLLVVPAGWLLLRPSTGVFTRAATAVALGPVLIALGFAGWHLNWWSLLDGVLLVLLVATTGTGTGETSRAVRWTWTGSVLLVLLLGVIQLTPSVGKGDNNELGKPELVGLIERDLARWLAKHAGAEGAVVLAPPNQTTTLYYYGGLRGIGTVAWENKEGIGAAVRILSASTPEEAKELIDRRGITHLVIPTWDDYLDEYARIGMGQLEGTFLNGLHLWIVPSWLRPVAYQLPSIAGFEGQSVTIFEVVEPQDDAVALCRTAEYFIEMGQLNQAGAVGQALRRFPADFGALVTRAQVELARKETEGFARTIELLRSRLSAKGDRSLLWDRRVSLAVVLARSKQMDLARPQVQRCLAEVTEAKLRLLSTGALYRLLVLGKAFDLTITDPRLHALALDLLPADLSSRL